MSRPRTSIHPLADAYTTHLAAQGLARSTVLKHRQVLDRFFRDHDPATVDQAQVNDYLGQLHPATRRKAEAVLRSLFIWLRAHGHLNSGFPAPADGRMRYRIHPDRDQRRPEQRVTIRQDPRQLERARQEYAHEQAIRRQAAHATRQGHRADVPALPPRPAPPSIRPEDLPSWAWVRHIIDVLAEHPDGLGARDLAQHCEDLFDRKLTVRWLRDQIGDQPAIRPTPSNGRMTVHKHSPWPTVAEYAVRWFIYLTPGVRNVNRNGQRARWALDR